MHGTGIKIILRGSLGEITTPELSGYASPNAVLVHIVKKMWSASSFRIR
jgi:hypothetical protein